MLSSELGKTLKNKRTKSQRAVASEIQQTTPTVSGNNVATEGERKLESCLDLLHYVISTSFLSWRTQLYFLSKCLYGQKFFSSVLVFLECLEEYSKKKFDSLNIFSSKSCFKVPASAMLNEDDRELLSLGLEQAMTSLQGSSTFHFSVSLFFHTISIIFWRK